MDTLILTNAVLFLSTLSLRRATDIDLTEFNAAVFLSTLSLRRATVPKQGFSPVGAISIHALLAESDSQWRTLARGI